MSTNKITTALGLVFFALGIAELCSSVEIANEGGPDSVPAFALAFGVLFLTSAVLVRSRRPVAGAVLGSVLMAFEIASFPSWHKHGVWDWSFDVVFVLACVAGLVLVVSWVLARRQDRRGAFAPADPVSAGRANR